MSGAIKIEWIHLLYVLQKGREQNLMGKASQPSFPTTYACRGPRSELGVALPQFEDLEYLRQMRHVRFTPIKSVPAWSYGRHQNFRSWGRMTTREWAREWAHCLDPVRERTEKWHGSSLSHNFAPGRVNVTQLLKPINHECMYDLHPPNLQYYSPITLSRDTCLLWSSLRKRTGVGTAWTIHPQKRMIHTSVYWCRMQSLRVSQMSKMYPTAVHTHDANPKSLRPNIMSVCKNSCHTDRMTASKLALAKLQSPI